MRDWLRFEKRSGTTSVLLPLLIGLFAITLSACDSGGSGMTEEEETVSVSVEGVVVDATEKDALLAKSGQPSQVNGRTQDGSRGDGTGGYATGERPPDTSDDDMPSAEEKGRADGSSLMQDQLVRPLKKDGVPIEGAEVAIYEPKTEGALASATTKSNGSYKLSFDIEAGDTPSELQLEVQAEQFTRYRDTIDFDPSITYDVALEELGPGAPEVSGTVTDFEDRTPIDGATVTGYAEESENGEQLFKTETDASGEWDAKFRVQGTTPNELVVEAQADDYSLEQRSTDFSEEMNVALSLVDENDESISELNGDSNEKVTDATENFSASFEISEDEVSNIEEKNEAPVVRTIVEIALKSDLSVQRVNRLLRDYDARIVDMLPDRPYLTVRIPDPGSIEELQNIIENIEDEEGVRGIRKGKMAGTDAIPDHVDLKNDEGLYIRHHLAVRAPAAWNLREAIQAKPRITVTDMFGDGTPDDRFRGEFPESDDFRETLETTGIFSDLFLPNRHGYHVLGVINASFDRKPKATGVFPGQAHIRAVDLGSFLDSGMVFSIIENRVIRRIEEITSGSKKAVLNTSLRSFFEATEKGGKRWYKKVKPKNGKTWRTILFTSLLRETWKETRIPRPTKTRRGITQLWAQTWTANWKIRLSSKTDFTIQKT